MSNRNHRKNRFQWATRSPLKSLIVLVVLITTIVIFASAKGVSSAEIEGSSGFSIWLQGPIQAAGGEMITYTIETDADDLFGAQIDLNFDPAVLQAVATQVKPGSCPQPDFVVTNSVDNAAGIISYAATSLAPSLPCDGGVVASFQFQVSPSAEGSTQVQFESAILADINGLEIPVTPADLNLEIITISADFSGSPTAGLAPLTVNFTNLSTGVHDACTWNFGDSSGSSSCANQSHLYTAPGTYTVQLDITGSGGSDNETKVDYIIVKGQFSLHLPVIMHQP